MPLKEYRCNIYIVKNNRIIKKDYTIFFRIVRKNGKGFKKVIKTKPLLKFIGE